MQLKIRGHKLEWWKHFQELSHRNHHGRMDEYKNGCAMRSLSVSIGRSSFLPRWPGRIIELYSWATKPSHNLRLGLSAFSHASIIKGTTAKRLWLRGSTGDPPGLLAPEPLSTDHFHHFGRNQLPNDDFKTQTDRRGNRGWWYKSRVYLQSPRRGGGGLFTRSAMMSNGGGGLGPKFCFHTWDLKTGGVEHTCSAAFNSRGFQTEGTTPEHAAPSVKRSLPRILCTLNDNESGRLHESWSKWKRGTETCMVNTGEGQSQL